MSLIRKDFGLLFEVEVGSEKPLTITVKDPVTGDGLNMTDVTQYDSGVVKIVRPNGTIIVSVAITFDNRANGLVGFKILDTTTILANAGNWQGNLEILNDAGKIVQQLQFNYNIIESY